jgi:integrase
MPYIEPDRKTGIYQYRRRIPAALQPVLNMKFFYRSLGTARKPEANRLAVEVGREFERLIANARENVIAQGGGEASAVDQKSMIEPTGALEAIEQWSELETEKNALEVANGLRGDDESVRAKRSDLIVALRNCDTFRGFGLVPEFDVRLVKALASRGVLIAAEHPVLRILRPAFRDAWLRVEEDLDKMQRGGGVDWDWSKASQSRATSSGEISRPRSRITNPTLSEAVKLWSTGGGVEGAKKPAKRTIQEAKRGQKLFIDLHGDLPVREITGVHAFALQNMLARGSNGTAKAVQARTINKMLNLLSGVMKFAKQRGVFADMQWSNPFAMAKMNEDLSAAEPYEPFSTEELNKLLASPVFADGARPKRGHGDTAKFAPLVALFSGARRGEVLQLFVRDVFVDPDTNVWCFRFNDDDGKTLKTSSSFRITPLHPFLIDLGLIGFVQQRAEQVGVDASLWPGFEDRVKLGSKMNRWGEWFSAYLAKNVVDAPEKKFHSFRGTFKRFARDTLDEDVINRLVGHAHTSVGSRYGRKKIRPGKFDSGISITRMAELISRIKFTGVNFSNERQVGEARPTSSSKT